MSRGGAALPLPSPTEKPELLISQPHLIALPSNLAPSIFQPPGMLGTLLLRSRLAELGHMDPEHRGLPTC